MLQLKIHYLVACLLIIILNGDSFGQSNDTLNYSHDTTYYQTFPEYLTARTYFSRKFTGFNVEYADFEGTTLKYAPNTTRNFGIGATYNWFTLNLAYGFSFLNPDQGKGKTDYLDLQSHIFAGKFNIDLLGQFYTGYYLKDYQTDDGQRYVRPDLKVTELGVSVQYVLNNDRFSFAAAFQNTGYQKKSAGSLLIGWDIFYGRARADSSLVPQELNVVTPDYDRLGFLKIGPQIGYAHTFVFLKHYYLTGSLAVALNAGLYRLKEANQKDDQYYMSADLGVRIAAGYNSERFTIGSFFVVQRVQASDNYRNIISTGNLRVIAAYRFLWKNPPKILT